ncbi:thermonuclease family protein [Nocardioides campestrisoli]|uniref:thermonuclease family protein n=1 Tax=Nocardioides campestrisoli TaxID=2736757 RepID=UPI00163DC781|nr:thermonuclease family protein [Nocardioides campestrisoli]
MRKTVTNLGIATALTLGVAGGLAGPAHAGDMDCGDFPSQRAAQLFFLNNSPAADPHRLDADGDWRVCESNPAPYYFGRDPRGGAPAPTPTPTPAPAPPKPPKPQVVKQWARVIKVTDGDTVKVRLAAGGKKDVRVLGIDTPEVFGGVECGGREASDSMKSMLPRRTRVLLISDPSQDLQDRYGRILRYIHKKGKLDVGRRQVFKGHAEVYVFQGNPFQRTSLYKKAERQARNTDRGIWGYC